jgi:hypothetical protein
MVVCMELQGGATVSKPHTASTKILVCAVQLTEQIFNSWESSYLEPIAQLTKPPITGRKKRHIY